MCSYTDRNGENNTLASTLYSPKKQLFSDVCENTTESELQDICNNPLLTDYSNYAECPNGGFFVSKEGDNSNLYVLDSNLNEVDQVPLNVPDSSYIKDIQGIAYDPDLSKLYVAHNDKVFSTNNQGDFIKDEINPTSLASISNTTSSVVSSGSCRKPIVTSSTSSSINSLGLVDNNLLVTYNQNGSSFMSKITTNGNLVNTRHIDDGIEPNTTFETSKGVHVLAKKNNNYNYLYTFDKNNCKKNCCEIVLDSECRVDIECDDGPCNLDGSLCEVVRSVALIENALAKLIECESEKVKATIEKSRCSKELLDINNSVSKTIVNISMLEQVLKEKLEVALQIYEKDCHHHCK